MCRGRALVVDRCLFLYAVQTDLQGSWKTNGVIYTMCRGVQRGGTTINPTVVERTLRGIDDVPVTGPETGGISQKNGFGSR